MADDSPERIPSSPPSRRGTGRLLRALLWTILPVILIASASLIAWFVWQRGYSPLSEFLHFVSEDAAGALHIDFATIRNVPGIDQELAQIEKALNQSLGELDLQPKSAKLTSVFASGAKESGAMEVWTFDRPVQIGKAISGRFHPINRNGLAFWKDEFGGPEHWCVDQKGRLIFGRIEPIEAAFARMKGNYASAASRNLLTWSTGMSTDALTWAVADFSRIDTNDAVLFPLNFGDDLKGTRINGLLLSVHYSERDGPVLKGKWFCPTHSDAKTCAQALDALKARVRKLAEKFEGNADLKRLNAILAESTFHAEDAEVRLEVSMPIAIPRIALQEAGKALIQARFGTQARIAKTFQEQLERGEDALAKGHFKDADDALSHALRLFPENARAKEKMAELKDRIESKRQFDGVLEEAAKALAAKDLQVAREKILAASNLRPKDSRVLALVKELAGRESELAFQKAVNDGDRALTEAELQKALELFQKALAIRPGDARAEESILSIQSLQNCRAALDAAKASLDQKQVAQAHAHASKAIDAVFGAMRKKLDGDKRHETALKQLTNTALPLVWQIAKRLQENGESRQAKARESMQKDEFALAVAEFQGSREALAQARDFVQAIRSFATKDDAAAIEKQEQALRDRIVAIESMSKKATSLDLLRQGEAHMKEGRAELTLAKKESSHLRTAEKAFADARTKFDAARLLLEPEAEDRFKKAEQAVIEVAKLIKPFELDFKKDRNLAGWTYAKEQWVLRSGSGETWLQSTNAATAILSSPQTDFPADFDLVLQFAMVDAEGQPRNQFWKFYPNFLAISVKPKGKETLPLSIALGKDQSAKFQDVACVSLANKSFSFLADKQQTRVILGLSRRQGTAMLRIGQNEISSIALPDDFHQVTVQVNNAKDGGPQRTSFVAIYRMSMKMNEMK
jgi:hypothetical protein